jgi:hypothetical protein
LFFLKDDVIAQKIKLLILFKPLIKIERIKASRLDTDLFYKNKN